MTHVLTHTGLSHSGFYRFYPTLLSLLLHNEVRTKQFETVLENMKLDYSAMYANSSKQCVVLEYGGFTVSENGAFSPRVVYQDVPTIARLSDSSVDTTLISMAIQKSKYDGTDKSFESFARNSAQDKKENEDNYGRIRKKSKVRVTVKWTRWGVFCPGKKEVCSAKILCLSFTFRGSGKIGELGNFREDVLFQWSLCRRLRGRNFPNDVFCLWEFPRELGRKGSAKGVAAIFAKTCFEVSVGGWSAWVGEDACFLVAFFGFSQPELSAHNPEVVGSSPASATIKVPKTTWFSELFFAYRVK